MSSYKFTSRDGKEVRILKDVKDFDLTEGIVTYERNCIVYKWYLGTDFNIEKIND